MANPEKGARCGECRLGLGVHNTADPQCTHHVRLRLVGKHEGPKRPPQRMANPPKHRREVT